MNGLFDFLRKNARSWTVKLGLVAGLLIALGETVLPTLGTALKDLIPGSEAWLVVAAMYAGRAVGFVRKAQTALDAIAPPPPGDGEKP
jgi:hypothetical protein